MKGVKSEIQMKTYVVAIRDNIDGVEVEASDGRKWKAKFVLCALPFSAPRLVRIEPGLTGLQAEGLAGLDYTPVFQVHFQPKKILGDGWPAAQHVDRPCARPLYGATQ